MKKSYKRTLKLLHISEISGSMFLSLIVIIIVIFQMIVLYFLHLKNILEEIYNLFEIEHRKKKHFHVLNS